MRNKRIFFVKLKQTKKCKEFSKTMYFCLCFSVVFDKIINVNVIFRKITFFTGKKREEF